MQSLHDPCNHIFVFHELSQTHIDVKIKYIDNVLLIQIDINYDWRVNGNQETEERTEEGARGSINGEEMDIDKECERHNDGDDSRWG